MRPWTSQAAWTRRGGVANPADELTRLQGLAEERTHKRDEAVALAAALADELMAAKAATWEARSPASGVAEVGRLPRRRRRWM